MSNPNTDRDGRVRAPQIDWQQVVLNGGPPCFFVEGPQYCGRAERWPGHGNEAFHDYVSLNDLLTTVREEARETAFKEALDATTRVHLACGATGSADFQEGIRNGVILGANQIREALRATIEAAASSPTPAESDETKCIHCQHGVDNFNAVTGLCEFDPEPENESAEFCGCKCEFTPAERTRVEGEQRLLTPEELADIERFQRQRRKNPVSTDAWLYVAEIDRLLTHIRLDREQLENEIFQDTTDPTFSDSARRAAEEIADRWFRDDLPERARVQSSTRIMLRMLSEEVIAKHFAAAPADNDAELKGESNA